MSDELVRTIPLLPHDSPFQPDAVMPPELRYDGGLSLSYGAADEQARVYVSFEGLDSVRACRGQVSPYPRQDGAPRSRIRIVRPSPWLPERYAYEAEHYGDAYEWGRGADTMLVDTHHYLFLFHDEFVEVLARGVWFERGMAAGPLNPFDVLPAQGCVVEGEHDGIRFEVREAGRPEQEVVADARLCSQPLFQLLIDGNDRVSQQIRVRAGIDGETVWADAIGVMGVETGRFDHLPSLNEVLPHFTAWISEVAGRRREMQDR
jgi:hypothetical protein